MKRPGQDTAESGLWGERVAERFLMQKGLKVLSRRVTVGKHDEIDLVARDGEALVFIEVKTRRVEDFGRPVSAVDGRKQHALSRAAVGYMRKLKRMPCFFRFDVVEVVGCPNDDAPEIRHIENAFTLDRRYTLVY